MVPGPTGKSSLADDRGWRFDDHARQPPQRDERAVLFKPISGCVKFGPGSANPCVDRFGGKDTGNVNPR